MALNSTYTCEVTVPAEVNLPTNFSAPGEITLYSTASSVYFTPLVTKNSGSAEAVTFVATFSIPGTSLSTVSGELTLYTIRSNAPNSIATDASPPHDPMPAFTATLTTSIDPSATTINESIISTGSVASPQTSDNILATSYASSTSSAGAGSATQSAGNSVNISSNGGYSSGELAGAAVGGAFGGALIIGLALFLFFRSRIVSTSPRADSCFGYGTRKDHFGVAVTEIPVARQVSDAWEKHLPQSESDQVVRRMVCRTLDQIELYVENFYQDRDYRLLSTPVDPKICEFDSGCFPEALPSLIRQTGRPTCLIKNCIAYAIVCRIEMNGSSIESFLPDSMAAMRLSTSAQEKPGFAQAYSQWRVVSAYLRESFTRDASYLEKRDRRISAVAKNLCQVFEPWARSTDNSRLQQLISIMERASELGVMLLSQPASFSWQWEDSDPESRRRHGTAPLVVLPGLSKVTDEKAVPLEPPMCLVEPRVLRGSYI